MESFKAVVQQASPVLHLIVVKQFSRLYQIYVDDGSSWPLCCGEVVRWLC